MMLALICFGAVTLGELLLWLPAFWQWRKPAARLLLIAVLITTVFLVIELPTGWGALIMLVSTYRSINLLRLVEDRSQSDYLFHTGRRSSLWLISLQLIVLVFLWLSMATGLKALSWWYVLVISQLIGALIIATATIRQLKTTAPPVLNDEIPNSDLPSLTVAIPARNETTDLEACLVSLLKNNYRKLEILVLDDCSQNRHTSEIIRGFAHDGVRFVSGDAPPNHWLAKNYAYEQLYRQANGELILFCGVDARFGPNSLQTMVKTILQKKKSMLCIVPRSLMAKQNGLLSSLVQSCRYAWELALPRRFFERPPVLSSCWLISKQTLKEAGGFASYKQSILPERHLAHRAAEKAQGYTFICSGAAMGVSSRKSFDEQLATATRTRYPQLHRRPEMVLFTSLAEFTLLFWPYLILIISLVTASWALGLISLLTCFLLTVFYVKIVNLTYRRFLLRGFMLMPFAALYDIGLLNYSMWQYEFHEVIWKGRNICMPVMRVYPSLPKID